MTKVLHRYLRREMLQTWLIVTLVLLLILVINQFASVLGEAAANKLPRTAIFQALGLTTVQYLTILIPVGFFLAVLLTLARLNHDSEMAAMLACGVGPGQLYRSIFALGGGLALMVGVLALVVSPAALLQMEVFAAQARQDASLGLLQAGRFVTFAEGTTALYAQSMTSDDHLHKVFVQRRIGGRLQVIVADEAWQSPGSVGVRVLKFARGTRYEGEPGARQFRLMEFTEHGIPFELPANGPRKIKPKILSTRSLLTSGKLEDRAEFHWRVGVPFTLLVLAFFAVPLAKTQPRKGRFAGLATGVLVYLIYANLLVVGRGWLERGQIPEALGLWWVHGLFLLCGWGLLASQLGWRRQWTARLSAFWSRP